MMISIFKSIVFVTTLAALSLIVFPAAAQITTLTGPCGFTTCSGGEDFGFLATTILGIIHAFLILVAVIATMFLIYAGVLYISSTGDEEKAQQAKRQAIYALIGLILAGGAEIIAFAFEPGTDPQPQPIIDFIIPVVNALLTLAAIAAAIYIIIAGVRYITSQGSEEEQVKAKNGVIYAVIGLIVIALSAVIVNFIVAVI